MSETETASTPPIEVDPEMKDERHIIGTCYDGPSATYTDDKASWPPLKEYHLRALTREQAGLTRSPEIRNGMFELFYTAPTGGWWVEIPNGGAVNYKSSVDRGEALVLSLSDVLLRSSRNNIIYQLSDEEVKYRRSMPKRRCQYSQFISPSLEAMLHASPTNETFRALLMKKVMEPIPKELDTFGKIKDWVEFNFPKEANPLKTASPLVTSFIVSAREIEYGKCRYTLTKSGEGTFKLTADKLKSLMNDAADMDELMSMIHEQIEQQSSDWMTPGDESTDGHEPSDSDGLELDYSNSRLRREVQQFIRENGSAEDRIDFLEE